MRPPSSRSRPGPVLTDMSRLQKLLWAAERPIVLLGGSRWSAAACAAVARFAERFALPVATTFRRAHLFDPDTSLLRRRSRHRAESQAARAREGGRPHHRSSAAGWARCRRRATRCSTFRGRARPSCMCIPTSRSSAASTAPHLRHQRRADRVRRGARRPAAAERAALARETPVAHADYLAWTDKPTDVPGAGQSRRDRRRAAREASRRRHDLQRRRQFLRSGCTASTRYRRYGTELAPISGSMGYGVPAAIGMKRLAPERTVVAFAGDGDFLMTGQEFATAVQYDLPVIIVVVDNGMYGTIRMHQERQYPGRVVGTASEESGFRRLCARVRRLRSDGGEDRGFLAGVRGGAASPASPRSSISRSIPRRSRRRCRSPPPARRRRRAGESRAHCARSSRDTGIVTSGRTGPCGRACAEVPPIPCRRALPVRRRARPCAPIPPWRAGSGRRFPPSPEPASRKRTGD